MRSLPYRRCALGAVVSSFCILSISASTLGGPCPGSQDVSENQGETAAGESVLCQTADSPSAAYARVHDLSQGSLAGSGVEVHCVTWNLEFAISDHEAEVSLWLSDDGMPGGDTLLASQTISVTASDDVIVLRATFDPPIFVEADSQVVAMLSMPHFNDAGAYFVGANSEPQASASWIDTMGSCGLTGWHDLADVGWPDVSWVESINCSPSMGPDPCDEELPPFASDVDRDFDCDVDDLLAVLGSFGQTGDGSFRPTGDVAPLPNGDCTVNVDDLLMVLGTFGAQGGACCIEAGGSSICYDHQTQAECEAKGKFATWLGPGSTCPNGNGEPCGGGTSEIMLNELRANQAGEDTDEYFELIGPAGASLDGITFIAIGDGSSDYHGVIEEVVDLTGHIINADGFFLVGQPEMLLGTPDYAVELNFESSDQVTFVLVSGFTGALGDDVDTDNDGVMDVMPWDAAIDCIAFIEEVDDYSDHVYCSTTVGPDNVYTPGGARKCPDADGDWYDNGFNAADFVDTPGAANYCDFTDSDGDGVIDGQDNCPDMANPDQADCDGDGIGDVCAIADGISSDCNDNGTPDNCEDDCNFNGVPDDCDVADGTSSDCDGNGIPDECDPDCNANGQADACDIADGSSSDDNGNGVPDECEGAAFVINEIHADPDSTNGDANGDGEANYSSDEFVEIVNLTGEDIQMGGWQIHDAVGLRHEIGFGTVLSSGCSLVVFGGGDPADFTGDFGGAIIEVASTGYLGFNNSGDTVTVLDADGMVVLEVSYGSEGGDNQSLTRYPDIHGESFYKHSTVSTDGTLFSPGTTVDGESFGGDCGNGGGGEDADGDGVPDEYDNCDLYNPDQADCNDNGIGDVCDIADGTSEDADGDGIPDECQVLAEGVWFNEIHYDNAGGDVDEMIEVVLIEGTNPADVTVTLYNGNGGNPYGSSLNVAADFTAGETGGNWSIWYVILPANGLQNGAPDGMCVDVSGSVAQFISYEGQIDAASGPAAGMTSMDIGVMESSGTSIGSSLGLTGPTPSGATWVEFVDLASPGSVNDGQTIE